MKITLHLLSCRMLCNGISGCFFQSQDCKSTQFCNKTLCHHLAQSEISLMICRESRFGNCSELQWTLMAYLQIFPLHMRRIACLVPTRSKLAFKLNGFVISIADFLHNFMQIHGPLIMNFLNNTAINMGPHWQRWLLVDDVAMLSDVMCLLHLITIAWNFEQQVVGTCQSGCIHQRHIQSLQKN